MRYNTIPKGLAIVDILSKGNWFFCQRFSSYFEVRLILRLFGPIPRGLRRFLSIPQALGNVGCQMMVREMSNSFVNYSVVKQLITPF